MSTIGQYMTRDHRRCDGLFAAVEEAVAEGDWARAAEIFRDFVQGMERHLRWEEELLFPAFEQGSGITGGPTEVMRSEHAQMCSLLGQMQQALECRDGEGFLGLSETALIMMQQHNLKEEQVLYAMMDRVFGAQAAGLLEQAERLGV